MYQAWRGRRVGQDGLLRGVLVEELSHRTTGVAMEAVQKLASLLALRHLPPLGLIGGTGHAAQGGEQLVFALGGKEHLPLSQGLEGCGGSDPTDTALVPAQAAKQALQAQIVRREARDSRTMEQVGTPFWPQTAPRADQSSLRRVCPRGRMNVRHQCLQLSPHLGTAPQRQRGTEVRSGSSLRGSSVAECAGDLLQQIVRGSHVLGDRSAALHGAGDLSTHLLQLGGRDGGGRLLQGQGEGRQVLIPPQATPLQGLTRAALQGIAHG